MASLGQIIFCSMLTLILFFSAIIALVLSLTFSHHATQVVTNNKFPVANMGQDQLLSCQLLDTSQAAFTSVSVTWEKTGTQGFVYRYLHGGPFLEDQIPEFEGRAELFPDALKSGNVSLLLRSVRVEDEGVYSCTADSSSGGGMVNLLLRTAAYEAPVLSFSGDAITARAGRWFPRPNVTWTNHNKEVLEAATTMEENSAGIFSVVSTLPRVNTSETYTVQIKNNLVASISRARITGPNVTASSYFSFSGAPPAPTSVCAAVVAAAVACVCSLM